MNASHASASETGAAKAHFPPFFCAGKPAWRKRRSSRGMISEKTFHWCTITSVFN